MMVQALAKQLTLDEFLSRPETKPAGEYIDGQVIQKPMPQGKHSRFQGKLVSRINAVVEDPRTALAFPELRCTFGGRSTIPDISVFTWDRLPIDSKGDLANTFTTPPDWTIEILSPDQNQTKVVRNILHCLNHGCQLGWLIDPEERSVFIYPPGQQTIFVENLDDLLIVPEFASALQLSLADLWSWLQVG
jgi:Uma2 family endonuclease